MNEATPRAEGLTGGMGRIHGRPMFEIPEDVAYFNAAYNGPLLRSARLALERAVAAKSRPWERQPDSFFADADQVRALSSELFGASPDDWAIVPSATYGIATAARIVEPSLGPAHSILVLEEEFPANVLPWRRVAAEKGCRLQRIEKRRGGDCTAEVLQRIESSTRVVALPHCHWTDGTRLDLVQIGEACRGVGARLVLDVTQSLGALQLDLAAIDPDFLVAAGYKWLLFPYGVSLLYVASRHQHGRPLEESWLARQDAQDFAGLVRYNDAYRAGARRFDVSEACTALLPGAIAALEQLRLWGVARISETLAGITGEIVEGLTSRGFEFIPSQARSPHLVGGRMADGIPEGLVAGLRRRNVHVSQRGNLVRFAPHVHVSDKDMSRLFKAFDAAALAARE